MIKLTNLAKRYGDRQLFDHLTIAINQGEKVLIKAPSGSGKTTLIKMLLGFELPDSGTIEIGGLLLTPKSVKAIRSQIAYVSQDSDLEDGTVKDQLDFVFHFKVNRHKTDYIEGFKSLCPTFKLPINILETSIGQLSGGERQRVALIIALLLERPILILDEITSGLDSLLKEATAEAVVALERTLIIVSHDPIWQSFDQIRKVNL